MNNHKKLIYFIALVVAFICVLSMQIFAQGLTQTIRGKIIDQDSMSEIIGANVVVLNSDPILGGSTDISGEFVIKNVPIGRVTLKITSIGYEESVVPNIIVGTGKEVQINVQLRESFVKLEGIVINEKTNEGEVLNEMANVSARAFSVEETKRYSGSFNDPARMVANFSGVQGNTEGSNHIVVRGNSPNTVQWRLDGIEIPNPNHFAEEGSSGGAINVLNSSMLTNSDFFTGAFVPEYGNVLGGVFDMKLRTGNKEKREYSFTAGILGTDMSLEGPFKKGGNSSYLFNYRYSTLSLLDDMGVVDFGGVPKYQDLSFKTSFPTKNAGIFTIYGLGGISSIKDETLQEETEKLLQKGNYESTFGTFNINHAYFFNNNTSIETHLSVSQNGSNYKNYLLSDDSTSFYNSYNHNLNKYTYRISTAINSKINHRNTIKAGIKYNLFYFDFKQNFFNKETNVMETWLADKNNSGLAQTYATWKYRAAESVTFTTGVHFLYDDLTSHTSIEPRISGKWQINDKQSIFGGFGIHSQSASLPVYFSIIEDENGNTSRPNMKLDFMKARHYVLGYDNKISNNVYFKSEIYYQDLYDIPVENNPNGSFSLINAVEGFTDRTLVNSGTGTNYGLELTLERYFSNNYYYLVTTSLYDAKYKAMDGITRTTRFNGNYIANVLFGKEFYLKKGNKNKVLSLNSKVSLYGARNITPIDLDKSIELGRTIWKEDEAFSKKGDDIWKVDFSLTYSWNKAKTRQELKLDIQNALNAQGVTDEYYNDVTQEIELSTQLSIFPVVMYTLEF